MKKVVLITGGSDGLGKEIARVFKDDFLVIILADKEEKLKKTAKELGVDYFVCDVSSYKNCEEIFNKIIQEYKKIDCLINNAGIWIEGFLEENEFEKIKKTVEINLLGSIYLTKLVVPLMKKQKSGDLIFINSQAGLNAKAKRSVYTATKWGLNGFAKSLQQELSSFNIRVFNVYPGKMKTSLFEKAGVEKDLSNAFESKYLAKLIKEILLLPKEIVVSEFGIKNLNQ